MNRHKIAQQTTKGKFAGVEEYDHYIAVDWSSKIMAISRLTCRGEQPTVMERPADIQELKMYLHALRGTKIIAFEETTTAHWLYLEVRDAVDRIIICDPYRNKLLSDGPKTDKVDAAKLCLLLRAGLLKEVFHCDDDLYQLRRLVSAYEDVVKAGVRALNQRAALLRAMGSSTANDPTTRFVLESLERSIALYQEMKAAYEQKFETLCRRTKHLRILLIVTGIGTIGAVKILATVIDPRRFPDAGHYLSYSGLVMLEKTSGQRSYGRRPSRYSRRLKAVYKIAAMAAIGSANPIRQYYEYLLSKGVAEHNARHAVARYIAKVTYGILKSGQPYHPPTWRNTETPQTA